MSESMSHIDKTPFHSWKSNALAAGCVQCVKGKKLVMFVTGICPKKCFYCPLSEQKKDTDVIYANERQLSNENDVDAMFEEAQSCTSSGAGFTGGDPLTKIDRTCKYIKLLKEKFGKKFHIHLYTILESVNERKLQMLADAGLDEIRLHPDIKDTSFWKRIELFFESGKRKYSFNLGIEIPCIPGYVKETESLLEYFLPKVDFVNLNELEISDTNSSRLVDRGFVTRDSRSYAVQGSREMALGLMKKFLKKYPDVNIHFCTCKLKDGIQLRNRLKLRAEHTKKIFDIVTEDGTIVRGAIYLKGIEPGFGYRKKLSSLTSDARKEYVKKLNIIRNELVEKYSLPEDMIIVDVLKPRIITNVGVVEKLSSDLKDSGLIPAIVEQYPTYDQMEVDVTFL